MKRLTSIASSLGLVAVAGMALGACATGPDVERAKVRDAYASVRAAEAVGADQVPDAALHLELAREQIARAERLADKGETARARRMLIRARSDADLAMTLTRARVARSEAEAAQQRLSKLEAEIAEEQESREGSER